MVNNKHQDPTSKTGAGGSEGELGDDSLEARRKRLASELSAHRAEIAPEADKSESNQGYAYAVKLSSEFIAGVLVGAALGYLLDRLAGTSPWGMIVLLLLGFCAGVLNVLRSTGAISSSKPGNRIVDDGSDANDK